MEKVEIRESLQIECEFFGQEQASLVVLIAGAGAPAQFWPDFFCKNLADSGYRVLRYCHRDTGGSTHFSDRYDIWELYHDLVSLVEVTGKTPVKLIGHSMGGFLAQMVVCYSSLSVQSVVSISAGSAVESSLCAELEMSMPSDFTWSVLIQNQPTGNFESDLEGWLTTWKFLNGSVQFDRQQAVHYTKSLYTGDPRNAQVAVNHIHAMTTVPVELVKKLATISCPFLVLHGTEDVLVPLDNGQATARLVANSKSVGIEGAGHMFFNKQIWLRIQDLVIGHLTNHNINKIERGISE